MAKTAAAYNWMFRNRKTGRITIGQPANIPIKIFQGTTIAGVLLPKSRVRDLLGEVAVVSLAVWAVAEVTTGVNPSRRIAGGVTLASIAWLAFGRGRRRGTGRA